MTIRKYLHSCLLLESRGQRLLVDPGFFSFVEGKLKPEELGAADVLLLTHEHLDHFYPEAIKTIAALKKPAIFGTRRIQKALEEQGIQSRTAAAGSIERESGFEIQAVAAPHEPIPAPTLPENLGFLINQKIFHPGDSFDFTLPGSPEVLLLPVAGPWLTILQALKKTVALKPKIVIPIHDAIIKDFFLIRLYEMCKNYLAQHNIEFRPLGLGETLEISD